MMLSLVIAQITSEMGLASVDGSETIEWGVLLTSEPAALHDIIETHRAHRIRQNASDEKLEMDWEKHAPESTENGLGVVTVDTLI